MPSEDTNTEREAESLVSDTSLTDLVATISETKFSEWYDERQIEQNILDGKPYFNGPSQAKPPGKHSPSQLLQCHRKATYTRQNAPREGTSPDGIFWIGSTFEEEIIVPYLQDVVPDGLYVQNSLWIDSTVTVGDSEIRVRGSTDPAIVTADGTPILVTEIKTTTNVERMSAPKPHHKAQLHAYLHALDEDYAHDITNGVLLYGSRETLDLEVFNVAFDVEFWERVVSWMAKQTDYEENSELPPASPERDWECSYCSFKHRCGEADTPYQDINIDGLLPVFDGYDRDALEEYLDAHADADARLTPTLAHVYPELATEYGAYDWSCPRCGETYAWDAVDWDCDTSDPPFCPECANNGELLTLSGPDPDTQLKPESGE
ncbi:PD-(D/E)XK nuclease family protein [Halalkaliarchaeum sp. AArc-GB]|uniref:CRISPR-associated protein Cas4 n=1 Tax=Halalkaliarchaeum sp. AArc-GB TaxID=3074078 RepID=UPI002861AD44|nr:PD-(D/E)XK nuclease family protein [Halalkaliarchaeum sp. AArc-GB]MDR5672023.1 PD-(D/E)XK nuclease family protein [Halalkaliarchaeum sp. AArc-GB]